VTKAKGNEAKKRRRRRRRVLAAGILSLIALAGLATNGCSVERDVPTVLLLEYDDFGPQVIAHELVGFQWYQWDTHGYEEPGYRYNIRIVVYREGDLRAVKREYPLSVGKMDYRYVERDTAIKFLRKKIAECREAAEADQVEVAAQIAEGLRGTLKRIEELKPGG